MTPPEEESDQLPESQPSGSGGSQDTEDEARDEAEDNAGGADRDGDDGAGQATGNRKNAG
jgi:hypothetical protein